MNYRVFIAAGLLLGLSQAVSGQSLFLRSVTEPVALGSAQELRATSMYLVAPPEPRVYKVHDLVYVIISENSDASSQQLVETTKETRVRDQLNSVIDPLALLELRLRGSDIDSLNLLNLRAKNEFSGDGLYDRRDQFSARIAAEVIDVKPNGNVVLQAKKTIKMDNEVKVLVLSGLARQEDITAENTLLSSQIADLRIDVQHEGELRKSTTKGFLTRAIDTLFAF